jgi:hypothetical protein
LRRKFDWPLVALLRIMQVHSLLCKPLGRIWQQAPFIDVPGFENFDLLTFAGMAEFIKTLVATEKPVISRSLDYSDPNDKYSASRLRAFNKWVEVYKGKGNQYNGGPVSDIYYPSKSFSCQCSRGISQ